MDDSKKKIKKILVATDFSETADFALLRAIEIAKIAKARITIVHVLQRPFFDIFFEARTQRAILKSDKKQLVERMEEKVHSLAAHKLKIDYVLLPRGKAAVKILQYAKKSKPDLLVVGAHGKYSFRDSFVGTTAEYSAKKTRCPLLVVKKKPSGSYKKILIPADMSLVSKKAMNYAAVLFPLVNKQLLYVGDYEYDFFLKRAEKEGRISAKKLTEIRKSVHFSLEEKFKKFIKGNNKKFHRIPYKILLGYPGPTILQEAKNKKQDLIVMGTQGHNKHHYLFIGSVARWVLTGAENDILLIPPKR